MIALDPWLEPYSAGLETRVQRALEVYDRVGGDLLGPISAGHHYFGLNRGVHDGVQGVWYREWAPGANYVALVGDFNNWDSAAAPCERDEWGVWSRFFPGNELRSGSRLKVHVGTDHGSMDRIPAYIRQVVQDPVTHAFSGVYEETPAYDWHHPQPLKPESLRIYEAHVGMAREDGQVGTFREFADNILPKIIPLGYNAVQLMAVMEHPYYASFGYHVSSFFAPTSRFGSPDDLRYLVDRCHEAGLLVVMDLVHSHAIKNLLEGLRGFDGTDYQYFHAGAKGEHPAWDSMCFDYSKTEVLRFLLSNVRYWLEEFRMDGFRMDGVTSMVYRDHGLGRVFGSYDDYFGENVDLDAVAYLTLANALAHQVNPECVMIAEDMSGFVGMARPVDEGGVGFDYRLAMGIPDLWIKILKEKKDEDWNLERLFWSMTNRRRSEKNIAYVESHDQALVGDKTIAFWLMDQHMYSGMSKLAQDPVVDRGVALHKMIRLMTFALGGEGYLNFMGNEFGHPEWIDFPREGNGYSHHYARRQWSLPEQDHLHYSSLLAFDQAMLDLDELDHILSAPEVELLWVHEEMRVIVFRRGRLVFAFNFHPSESFTDLAVVVPEPSDYVSRLDTDQVAFGGQGRIDSFVKHIWEPAETSSYPHQVRLYLPARTALVLKPAGL